MKIPPLPVLLALIASATFGLIGLGAFTGLGEEFVRFAWRDSQWWGTVAMLVPFGMVVLAGELAASRLIVMSRRRRDESAHATAWVALGVYALIAAGCVFLAHEGLLSAGRPVIDAKLQAARTAVAQANADLTSAQQTEADARSAEADRARTINAQMNALPTDWAGARERVRLRAELRTLENGAADRIADEIAAVADARRKMATKQSELDAASRGFLAASVRIGDWRLALVPALLALAIVILKDWYGRIDLARPKTASQSHLPAQPQWTKLSAALICEIVHQYWSFAKQGRDELDRRGAPYVRPDKKPIRPPTPNKKRRLTRRKKR